MRRRPIVLVLAVALGFASSSGPAAAALTPSELAQVRDLVSSARGGTAPARIRALVARPDLSDEEAAAALSAALVGVPFTPARAQLLRDVVFGGEAVVSRPVLAVAAVRGLLARADAVIVKQGDRFESDEAASELARIYAFLAREIAAAPGRRGAGREPQNGISLAAYDDAAKALGAHVERHRRILRDESKATPLVAKVRAQAKLALVDMMNDGPTVRVETADRLGLVGARRSFYTELGVLVLDAGVADDVRVDRIRAVLSRLPGARAGTSAVYFGQSRPELVARGFVLGIAGSLEGGADKGLVASTARENIFPDEVEPVAVDPVAAELSRELAAVVVERALQRRPELRARAERDTRDAHGDMARLFGGSPSTEAQVTRAVTALLVDGQRALDLAMVRFLAGRPETLAVVADALGVLAVGSAPVEGKGQGLALALGRARDDGASETAWLTDLELLADGSARAFSFGGAKWELLRGESGVVTEVRRGGAPLTLAGLSLVRVAVREATEWKGAGLSFSRLAGTPRAGVGAGGRVRLVGVGDRNFDSIVSAAPNDAAVEATLRVFGGSGGLLLRAAAGEFGMRGVAFLLEPQPKAGFVRVSLRAILDSGTGAEITPSVEVPYATEHRVRVVVRGDKIEATCGTRTLKGTLPPGLATGGLGLQADRGVSVEMSGLAVKKP